ncbi:MAG: YbaK/EbsC family protein [Deltaproteobacteria bacterium]|nr:YbaK/EbsC family protein [Deltaproteobacteria bacterium]
MAIARKLRNYLDEHAVHYHVLSHPEEFTAPEVAHALHVPGRMMAKTVLVKADGRPVLAAVSANTRLDLSALRMVLGASIVELASEKEIDRSFPDCETGAMPPFGNVYGLPVVVDSGLVTDAAFVFEGGTHHEAIVLSFPDFERLVHPQVADIGLH